VRIISCCSFPAPSFQLVHWAARNGLRDDHDHSQTQRKHAARRAGVRGETYAYRYLHRHGYVFVARNNTPRDINIEVRTRTLREDLTALPELSITTDKQRLLIRTAQRFLAERHVGDPPLRRDVLAIDNQPGHAPAVRLRKDAFSPQL